MEEGRSLAIKGPKTHAYAKIDALSAAVFEIEEVRNKPIDIVVVTGDVTTDGSKESLETALEFIQHDDIYRYLPARRVLRGLGADLSSRIIVPGNHDRYSGRLWPIPQQTPGQSLEEVFESPTHYPYAQGFSFASSDELDGDQNEKAIIFFVFDSTMVQPDRRDFYNKIARGRIELGECNRLRELATEIRKTQVVPASDGTALSVDYDKATKIVVLHHHPILPDPITDGRLTLITRIRRKLQSKLTLMENSDEFVQACCDAKVDFVLFGHQHKEYETAREAGGHIVRFHCCPSTSEFSETQNGFNVIDIHSEGRYDNEFHRWSAGRNMPKRFVLARRTTFDPRGGGGHTAMAAGAG
jgi:3',5'-cyclic AMP phosphodiesterase CpdA